MSGSPDGRVAPGFRPDREAQVTQVTAGVNPNPPAVRSASVPADAPPVACRCVIGPYSGLDTGGAANPLSEPY